MYTGMIVMIDQDFDVVLFIISEFLKAVDVLIVEIVWSYLML